MNNYENFNQSFSSLEPIYVYNEETKTVVDSGELRDCQAEIESHIDECSSLFLNDFIAEELAPPSVDFDDDTVVDVVPGRESLLDKSLRENTVFIDTASRLGLDIKGLDLNQIKNLVFDKIIENSNINKKVEVNCETKNVDEKEQASISQNGE